jgi:hypothetical protein
MQVGSEWSYVAKFGTQVMMDQRGSYKVVAYEPLTVPAGTFDCFKVEGKAEAAYRISYQQQIKETYWYCPKVNGIAKLQRETSTTSARFAVVAREDRIGADEVHAEGLSRGRAHPPRTRQDRGQPASRRASRVHGSVSTDASMSRNAGRNPPDFHARYSA